MAKMYLKKFLLTVAVLATAGVMAFTINSTMRVFAETGGDAGSGHGDGTVNVSGSCADFLKGYNGGTAQADVCGAAFQLLDVNDPSGWPTTDDSRAEIRNNVVPSCSKFGGQFYFLALARAKYIGGSISYTGQLSRMRKVHELGGGGMIVGGVGKIPYISKAGEDFASVLSNWRSARAYAGKHPEGFEGFMSVPWADVTWFCWSKDFLSTDSFFEAWSYVDSSIVSESTLPLGPDEDAVVEVSTEEDSVEVTFKHRLSYEKPDAPVESIFNPAETTWYTVVTEDGRRVGGEPQTLFTLANSGPTRTDKWQDMPDPLSEFTYTVDMSNAESKTVCSKIVYSAKNILWDENPTNVYTMNKQTSNGQEDSSICITLTKGQEEPAGSGDYTSKTTVTIPAQGDIPNLTVTSDEDGKGNNIYVSTDLDEVEVQFEHEIIWHGDKCPPSQPDGFDDACDDYASTPYTIYDESGGVVSSGVHSGDTGKEGQETVKVSVPKGKIVTVCREIEYTQKNIPFKSYTYWHRRGKRWYKRTHYMIVNPGGIGSSSGCAVITHPADPIPPGGDVGPYSTGNGSSGPMYAGEETNLGWSGQTQAYWTRRMMQWQAVVFQRPVSSDQGSVKGNLNNQNHVDDVCAWFGGPLVGGRCNIANGSNGGNDPKFGNGTQHTYSWRNGWPSGQAEVTMNIGSFAENMIVPDEVGSKYCNSIGFQFQYYYGIQKNDGTINWTPDGKEYWKIYDAACRSIAKKPSFAIWNGSMFTNGDVETSIANRFNPGQFNALASGSGSRLNYGSWDEYLAVIKGSVSGFATGSAYASGNRGTDGEVSKMTISNDGTLGNADVKSGSTTLNDRIATYLCRSGIPSYDGSRWTGITGTHIVRLSGNTISGNIELAGGDYDLYHLPQVVVCADGDINIAENVTRIDAWIVAPGNTVNTCPAWEERRTEARVNGHSNRSDCSNSLQINGPIIAGELVLKRSAGADPLTYTGNATGGDDRAYSAEVLNLSADNYLWAYSQAGSYSSSYSEAYTRELPPRY